MENKLQDLQFIEDSLEIFYELLTREDKLRYSQRYSETVSKIHLLFFNIKNNTKE